MTERRYNEEEITEIFRVATETALPGKAPLPTGEGMTLLELRDIGREVGIAPELIARAAATLDSAGSSSRRRWLGFPIGVSHTVELGRTLHDAEWERLIVDVRQTFDAKGRLSQDGALRQWTNGNLHVYLEPGAHGHRLRMRTYNGNSQALTLLGFVFTGLGLFAVITALAGQGTDARQLIGAGVFACAGIAVGASGLLRLPGWARRRLQQMQDIAARLLDAGRNAPDQPVR